VNLSAEKMLREKAAGAAGAALVDNSIRDSGVGSRPNVKSGLPWPQCAGIPLLDWTGFAPPTGDRRLEQAANDGIAVILASGTVGRCYLREISVKTLMAKRPDA